MNIQKYDVKKTRTGAIIAAIVFIAIMIGLVAAVIWGQITEPLPIGLFIFIEAIPLAVIIGVIIALVQRIKELKGGEYDEARKY